MAALIAACAAENGEETTGLDNQAATAAGPTAGASGGSPPPPAESPANPSAGAASTGMGAASDVPAASGQPQETPNGESQADPKMTTPATAGPDLPAAMPAMMEADSRPEEMMEQTGEQDAAPTSTGTEDPQMLPEVPDLPATPMDYGEGDGSDVVTIGDSWMDYALSGGGIEGALRRAGKQYRNYSRSGTQFLNGVIPGQYARAKRANADIKTVVMTGGGNDILLGGYSCDTREQCQRYVEALVEGLNELWTEMSNDGVQNVLYINYSRDAGEHARRCAAGDETRRGDLRVGTHPMPPARDHRSGHGELCRWHPPHPRSKREDRRRSDGNDGAGGHAALTTLSRRIHSRQRDQT